MGKEGRFLGKALQSWFFLPLGPSQKVPPEASKKHLKTRTLNWLRSLFIAAVVEDESQLYPSPSASRFLPFEVSPGTGRMARPRFLLRRKAVPLPPASRFLPFEVSPVRAVWPDLDFSCVEKRSQAHPLHGSFPSSPPKPVRHN